VDGKILIEILKKQFDVESDVDLSKVAGISIATVNKWKSNSAELTPRQIGNLVYKARKRESESCISKAIQPIVEYYTIDHADSRHGANWELIPSKDGRGKKVRQELEISKGIYIFYNSQCEAIYAGKAKKQNLWKEMNLAFNRERSTQIVWIVKHPEKGQDFTPAHQKLRHLQKTQVYLSDIATYFSAYKVEVGLIDNLEALMIRGFANDLTNVRMEKFKFE
jgi:hypothetical protein